MYEEATGKHWFVLRDLRRHNARKLAYEELEGSGFEVFVPLTWRSYYKKGREVKRQVPAICGLLFVHSSRRSLDPVIDGMNTLQYRYLRGASYCTPMTVRDSEMENFISVVRASAEPCYYQPGQVNPSMLGAMIRIIGGPMDGRTGRLMKVRGSSRKRLYVEVSGVVGVSVVIQADSVGCIEVINEPGSTPQGRATPKEIII